MVVSKYFINDFPFYERDDDGNIEFSHNPFSMPQGGMDALNNMDPYDIKAYQYDFVCNGYEMASGGVRNHSPEILKKAFAIAGYSEEVVKFIFALPCLVILQLGVSTAFPNISKPSDIVTMSIPFAFI